MDKEGNALATVWIMSILVALSFLLAGLTKLLFSSSQETWLTWFVHWGYSKSFMKIVGAVETIGAVLLVVPRLAIAGATMLAVIMVGAIYAHVTHAEYVHTIRPIIFLFAVVMIAVLRRRLAANRTTADTLR